MSLIAEYLNYQIKYEKKYGPQTVVLEEVGSFFEFYGVDNKTEKIGDAKKVAEILNIQLTRRNKSILENNRKNCLMAGFPTISLKRFLQQLLNNNYTVVLIEQVTSPPEPERKVTKIYSPSTYIDDPLSITNSSGGTNNLLSLYIDTTNSNYKTNRQVFVVGLSVIDLSTGENTVYQITGPNNDDANAVFEDTYRFMETFNPCEVIINVKSRSDSKSEEKQKLKKFILSKINLTNRTYHYSGFARINPIYYKPSYQNEFLGKIFTDTKMLTPVEYIDMETKTYALMSYILLLQFAYEHDNNIIRQINKPIVWSNTSHMTLYNDSIYQLNVVSPHRNQSQKFGSLFKVVDATGTKMGQRLLKRRLLNPITSPQKLNTRYNQIQVTIGLLQPDTPTRHELSHIRELLKQLVDIERMHRRMALGVLHPCELGGLYYTYKQIAELITLCDKHFLTGSKQCDTLTLPSTYKTKFIEYGTELEKKFDIGELLKHNLKDINASFFNKGVFNEIDRVQKQIDDDIKYLEHVAKYLSRFVKNDGNLYVKQTRTDRDGYRLNITKHRAKLVSGKLKEQEVIPKQYEGIVFRSKNQNTMYVESSKIWKASRDIELNRGKINTIVKDRYLEVIKQLYARHEKLFKGLSKFVGEVDFTLSGATIATKYGYCRPNIVQSDVKHESVPPSESVSFLDARQLRHPIIERLQDTVNYVPNDIQLGITESKNNTSGMLLYGINGSGKSCIMKSVGLGVIMAQAGLYVPASEFRLCPFRSIFTRICDNDNIFKGQSSFAVEMTELRPILKYATPNSLVIGDEICRGTEDISGLAIVAASIKKLAKQRTNFIFATHLHKLKELAEIKELPNVDFYYLSVRNQEQIHTRNHSEKLQLGNEGIIYERKLKKGTSDAIYGLEVAKYLLDDSIFIKDAYEIRNKVLNKTNDVLKPKMSIYNREVYVDSCQICDCSNHETQPHQLDVHHIKFQSECNEHGRFQHILKNSKSNLVVLCKKHHNMVHENKIKIEGYKQSSNGIVLDFQFLKKEKEEEEDPIDDKKNKKQKHKSKYSEEDIKKIMSYKTAQKQLPRKTIVQELKHKHNIQISLSTLYRVWRESFTSSLHS